MTAPSGRRLLAVLAHPDDETFGCGGLLARYAAEGAQVALVCATRGEVGEIRDPSLATSDRLGSVREAELRAACEVLGIRPLYLLGYRDSGMAGTPDNEHPQALHKADQEELTGRVVEIVRRIKPQVIITFDPNGGYGHPDHIAMHHAARKAFQAAGSATYYPEQLIDGLGPHRADKLYYVALPRSMIRSFRDAIVAAGVESDFSEMDPESVGTPDEEITTVVDVSGYAAQKERAAACHRTQVGGDDPFGWIPEGVRTRFLSAEHLVRAQPPLDPSKGEMEVDLFGQIAE